MAARPQEDAFDAGPAQLGAHQRIVRDDVGVQVDRRCDDTFVALYRRLITLVLAGQLQGHFLELVLGTLQLADGRSGNVCFIIS